MSGLQILIVSPEAARARSVADALRAGGHQVVVEADPALAAASLTRGLPDLLVLDLRTPGTDALAIARALVPPDESLQPAPLEAVEREHILATLRHTRGNKRRAAQLLGIARSTLIQKVRRYEIQLAEPDEPDV
jgi:DNA-binding NtrC family response regulator